MKVLSKGHKYFICCALVGAGTLFGVYGVLKAGTSKPPVNLGEVERKLTGQCEDVIRRSDFEYQPTSNGFEISMDGIGQYQGKLFQSAQIVTSCQGFTMTSMCMGLSCSEVGSAGGVRVELSFDGVEKLASQTTTDNY